ISKHGPLTTADRQKYTFHAGPKARKPEIMGIVERLFEDTRQKGRISSMKTLTRLYLKEANEEGLSFAAAKKRVARHFKNIEVVRRRITRVAQDPKKKPEHMRDFVEFVNEQITTNNFNERFIINIDETN